MRAHWAIENNLHWVLNVAFDEDSNPTRHGHSATNLSVLRHIALNLIKAEKNAKVGVEIKAGWDNNLLRILGLTQRDRPSCPDNKLFTGLAQGTVPAFFS